jgi:hypothetical protein
MARRVIRRFVFILLLCLLLYLPQAQAEPITAILLAIGFSAATASAITGALITAVVGSIISFGISALAGAMSKPKMPKNTAGAFGEIAGQRLNISRNSVESRKVIYGRVRTSGPMVFVTTTDRGSAKNSYLHLVIALAGHECEEIEQIYIDEDAVTLDGDNYVVESQYRDSGNGVIRVKKYLGTTTQVADPDLVSEVTEWTENHRLLGVTYIYCRLKYDRDNFPNGVPQISAIVKGKKVYDPRDLSTAYSTNPALCVLDYLTNSEYGLDADLSTEIDTATFIASANNCDEDVTLADSTTQKRYTCNGVVDTASKPIDILKDLSTSMAGVIPYVQGKFRCFSGYYTAPSISIDESWLAGDIEVQAKKPRNELFNAVKGVYVAPDKGWQPTDFPMVTNSTYETQDGGVRIIRDLELPFTTNSVEAQRIAKILLEQGRQGIIVKMPCNFKALQLSIMDTVSVSIDQLGWASKVFRVVQWELNIEGGFTLTLQEEASASYDWSSGEQLTIDPAPDTNLPDLFTVQAPGNPVITEELYSTTDGSGLKTKAVITWAESPHSYVDRYIVQYKLATDSAYTPGGFVDAPLTTLTLDDLEPALYDFQVKAINVRGVSSEFATTRKEIKGLTDPPSDVTGFTLNVVSGMAHVQWDPHPDLDVKVGGGFVLKWSSKTSGATWSHGVDIGPELSGADTKAVVELLAGTYMIKALDSGGRESVNASTIVSTVANLASLNAIATGDQHPTFPGTKTNMFVDADDDTLKLDGGGLFDDLSGNFDDAVGLFDSGGGLGFADSASYQFYNVGDSVDYWDLGDIYTARVSIDIDALIYDASELFDSADGNFDDRTGLFDGDDVNGMAVEFFIRTTDDDPSGTPTWSDWRKFLVGDYTARAFQFKMEIANEEISNNIEISSLSVSIDAPDRTEAFLSQAIASGGTTITYDKPFYGQPSFTYTLNGEGTPTWTHVTSGGKYTGVTVQVLNSGSGVGRTMNVYATGY